MTVTQSPLRFAMFIGLSLVIWAVTAIALAGLFMPSNVAADEIGPVRAEVAGRVEMPDTRHIAPAATEVVIVVDSGVQISADGATEISAMTLVRPGS